MKTPAPSSGIAAPAYVESEIRGSMRALPGFLQPFLTWLVARPLADQRPWNLSGWHHLSSAVLALVAGLGLSAVAATRLGFWLVLFYPGWTLTAHSVRKLRAVISHQCSHSNFSGNKKLDRVIGEVTSVVFLTQSYDAYAREHIDGHHSKKHMTLEDPTVAFIFLMLQGRAGLPKSELWRRFYGAIFNPLFHLKFLGARLSSGFLKTSWLHRLGVILFWGGLLGVTAYTEAWRYFFLVWLIPLTLVLHVSECYRLAGRHVFPATLSRRDRDALAGYTHGIFVGDRAPDASLPWVRRMLAWCVWWLRVVFVHLPGRLLVVVGDAPCHDYHHRNPKSESWASYIFAREKQVRDLPAGWPPYTEVWGAWAAVDACFESLSKADPKDFDLSTLDKTRLYQLTEAFEE